MASQVTNYKCAACTGPLHYVGASNKLECDYCGSTYDLAEMEAAYQGKEEKAVEAMAAAEAKAAEQNKWMTEHLSEDWGADSSGMKAYSCPSCGAELICDETTAATCCPYCGNPTVVPGQFAGALKPSYVIPFKTDKKQAIAALKKHYEGKIFLPKSFSDSNHIKDIQGVYVPFWLFDARCVGSMYFDATKKLERTEGDEKVITTEYYDVKRAATSVFEKVPVDASTKMPDAHMDSIEPYDYSELKEFSTIYMPGFLADKYDVDVEASGARMEERCIAANKQAIEGTVKEYSSTKVTFEKFHVVKHNAEYAMLPVWMLATKWNNQNFLFAMNGQTGKIVGDLPLDKGKFYRFFAGISAALIAIMMLVSNFALEQPLTGFGLVFLGILLPIFVAFIIVSIMKGSLYSVGHPTAKEYTTEFKIKLAEDTFIRSTEERKKIQQKQQQ